MSQEASEGEKKSGGCLKVLGVMLILGLVGTVVAGAVGTYIYLNWEDLDWPGMDELRAQIEAAEGGEGAAGADAGAVQRPVVTTTPKQGTSSNFAQWTRREDVLILVDYYADWCPPCKQLAPQLEALARNHGDKVVVVKVNIDEERDLAMKAGVQSIPDMRLLHGGKQLKQIIGYRPAAQLEQMVVKHAAILPPPGAAPEGGTAGDGTIQKMKGEWLPPGVTPLK
ncbi:MAG: thioredoxin [Akkermansiaceae bacterium]|nr:thioredoxin [Akkermansiaceae bacterium]NNM29341.1 thioredoxin [Akkermansiaceae bacterium]